MIVFIAGCLWQTACKQVPFKDLNHANWNRVATANLMEDGLYVYVSQFSFNDPESILTNDQLMTRQMVEEFAISPIQESLPWKFENPAWLEGAILDGDWIDLDGVSPNLDTEGIERLRQEGFDALMVVVPGKRDRGSGIEGWGAGIFQRSLGSTARNTKAYRSNLNVYLDVWFIDLTAERAGYESNVRLTGEVDFVYKAPFPDEWKEFSEETREEIVSKLKLVFETDILPQAKRVHQRLF